MTLQVFSDNTALPATTQNAIVNECLTSSLFSLCRQLEVGTVTFSVGGSDAWGEAFTSSTGRLGSVNTGATTAIFNTNKYQASDYTIQIEASTLTTSAFAVNNCTAVLQSTGIWWVRCSTGTYEQRRAAVLQTCFYGTTGGNAALKNTNFTGLTAVKSSDARDVGKRAYFFNGSHSNSAGSNGGHNWTASFADTTNNTNCVVWGAMTQNGTGGIPTYEMPTGTSKTIVALGGDPISSQVSNPATFKFGWTGTLSNYGCSTVGILLSYGVCTLTFNDVAGTSSSSTIDFFTTHSVPNMTALTLLSNTLVTLTVPTGAIPSGISKAIAVPKVADWESGADIQYKLQGVSSAITGANWVIITATSIGAQSNWQINNCNIANVSAGKWILYCTTGTDAVRRAQIYKTLFYGTDGTNPRASPTYIGGLTAIKTSTARDVGKRAYLATATEGANGVGTYTGTFANTSTDTACSTWSNVTIGGASTGQWELPSGTNLNTSGQHIGTDKEATELNNPATCQIDINNTGSGTVSIAALILCSGSISWAVAGTGKGAASIDFFTTNGVPLLTAATETFSANDTGYLVAGVTPSISSFTTFDSEVVQLIIQLTPKGSTPTPGYPSISSFGLRVTP